MKKTFIIVAAIFLISLLFIIAVPLFFKQKVLDITKSAINKNINAEVEFSDFNLSVFRNFPKATAQLENIVITGTGYFKDDTLVMIPKIRASLSLSSIFSKSGMTLEEIILDGPKINLLANEKGENNWDVMNEGESVSSSKAADQSATEDDMKMQLDKIEIRDATFAYYDKPGNTKVLLENLDFTLSGELYGSTTQLETEGEIENLTFSYNDIKYISNTTLKINTLFNADFEEMNMTLQESELYINQLPLDLSGSVDFSTDSTICSIGIRSKESDFRSFLELIPPVYSEYMEGIETSGSAAIIGKIDGFYFDENYPSFSLKLNIKNGNFKYVDLPEKIQNIKADINIEKPQGVLDLTKVQIVEAHAEVRDNPVDMTLKLDDLFSDLNFDGAFIGKINLTHLKDALPLDSVNLSGIIDANLFVKGNYESLEKEEFDKIKSDGIVLLDNVVYESSDFTKPVYIPKGQMDFSSRSINLSELQLKIGQSDFNLTGKVYNYLNYILKDGILKGDLQLNSNTVNLNELLRLQVREEVNTKEGEQLDESTVEDEILAFTIPDNIDITFRSNIRNAVFDRVPISNITGLVTANKGRLVLDNLNMNLLEGVLQLTGAYENNSVNQPFVDFGIDFKNIDIPMAYRSLTGIQRMIPVAGQSQGEFSSSLKFKGRLSENHKVIPSTINGNGLFSTKDLEINNSPVFNQLKGILKSEKLQNVDINDFKAYFTINDGNIDLKPFKTKIADQETQLAGSLSAENLLNLRLDFNVQRDAFGPDIQNVLSVIPGNKNIKVVPAGVIIKGPVGNPEVKLDLSETRKSITSATRDDIQKTVNKLGKGLKKLFEK